MLGAMRQCSDETSLRCSGAKASEPFGCAGRVKNGAETTVAQEPNAGAVASIRRFTRDDWGWVQKWFEDETLNNELGPLDEEWLEYVLAEESGVQLVYCEADGSPAALVGCVWDPAGIEHGITDLAVNPSRRNKGVGRRALNETLAWSGHPRSKHWVAFVDPENSVAFSFFVALGWQHEGRDGLMERFVWLQSAS